MTRLGWLVALTVAPAACSLMAPSDGALSGGVLACGPGQIQCGGACVSRLDPAFGCGTCNPCRFDHGTAICAAAGCTLAKCESGFDDCDGDDANGCEAALTGPTTCGRCGLSCHGLTPACADGVCVPRCSAIEFTATDARLEASSTGWDLGTSELTIELWLQAHGKFGGALGGSILRLDGGVVITLDARSSPVRLVGQLLTYPVVEYLEASIPYPTDGAWHHAAFVRVGRELTVWLDGKKEQTVTGAPIALTRTSTVFLGSKTPLEGSAAPIRLGPLRLSKAARYSAPFAPSTYFRVDEKTVTQWLSTQAFRGAGLGLVDEAGGENDARDSVHVEQSQSVPCP